VLSARLRLLPLLDWLPEAEDERDLGLEELLLDDEDWLQFDSGSSLTAGLGSNNGEFVELEAEDDCENEAESATGRWPSTAVTNAMT